jgi:diguanylate cyclase (GGDEF)-like protein
MDTAHESPLVIAARAAVRAPAAKPLQNRPNDVRVWALAVVMAAVALALLQIQVPHGIDLTPPPLIWWGVLPLFTLTEMYAIHLPTLRNAHSHTLREVPALIGLAFLSPLFYVIAYVVGAGVGLRRRSQRGLKLFFNGCLFFLEASLGMLTFDAVLGGGDALGPRGWAAAFAAILVTNLASVFSVTTAISVTEGRLDVRVLKGAIAYGVPAAVVNTCMALLCVVLAVKEPTALPLLGLALLVLFLAYRGYGALARGYSQLELLYQFVGSAGRAADVDEAIAMLLRNSCELLGADRAEFIALPSNGVAGLRTTIDRTDVIRHAAYDGPEPARDAWWASAALGEAVLRPADTGSGVAGPTSERPRDGVAVPLLRDGQVEAVLLVLNRTFEQQTFGPEDLRLLETLTGHAAVELDKVRVVERLKTLAAQREHEAHHDPLTGLPNRRAFEEAVETASGRPGAVLLIDLDDFKDINDTLGHMAGDALLRETGERVRFASDGAVARLGGDEFAVFLTGVNAEQATQYARDLLTVMSHPVILNDAKLIINASIGIALTPQHGTGTTELLQRADVAMYVAKDSGSGVEVYRSDDGELSQRRLVLAGDLEAMLDRHTFELWYQPQADATTGEIVAVEALLRWQHPVYGEVPPSEVVSLAERTGLLRRLTNMVLEDAVRQRARWSDMGYALNVSVNVTPTDLCDSELPRLVHDLLVSTNTPSRALTVEITESGVMSDPARCVAVLDVLAAQGVQLAVDDFGTGHSSLAYLEQLPVHEVKIDRSFVRRLEREEEDAKVMRATVALAHDLGMRVVAEGVESQIAWARVIDLGCELVQGYGLARPMTAADATAWLAGLGADQAT